jgi:hypothetical protein
VTPAAGAAIALASVLAGAGCAARPVADPRDATRAYAQAAERGDGAALYALMSSDSRKARSEAEVKAIVAGEKAELAEQAQALLGQDVRVAATARVRYPDGEEAALDLSHGRYWVTAAGALPGGGRTPEEAIEQLRRVLARRSYDGLLRILSAETRTAVENDVRALVEGLGEPAELPVKVDGDAATVGVPGGHQVKLRRQEGVWRVEDFD